MTTPARKHIFLDFDGTITTADTIGALAQFALDTQSARGSDLSAAWEQVVKAYMQGFKACVDNHHTPSHQRTTVGQEVEFLRQMKDSEVESLERIRECEVFRGIGADDFRNAGRRLVEQGTIQLREGFHEYVSRRIAEGCKVWVLSVNWSSAFIEGACHPSVVSVIANNVGSDGSIVGPELFLSPRSADHRTLTNSVDKLDAMRAALQGEGFGQTTTVYMGDSITDMECLLAADQAVIMSDKADSTLLQTLRRIGTDVKHIAEADPGSIAWASSFDDIEKRVL
ncbi:HAD-like domain-containing protein [Microdochium trichocladiopsis]|uniref:HAD-like domain-containing protein n=1 Tax=Microdochium trichocladiopsis TaxID=1682393 RepID=A0A9P8Y944_9PEZI|nr:HAD-like domain-containing protein [Microdochium trichocladiopsis]KAH7030960.1 HAD-like domain-containing protein [Microdochium trichocladiopsis]